MALPTYEELVGNEQLPTYDELTGKDELPSYDELTAAPSPDIKPAEYPAGMEIPLEGAPQDAGLRPFPERSFLERVRTTFYPPTPQPPRSVTVSPAGEIPATPLLAGEVPSETAVAPTLEQTVAQAIPKFGQRSDIEVPRRGPPMSVQEAYQELAETSGPIGGVLNAVDYAASQPIIDESQAKQLVGVAATGARNVAKLTGSKEIEQGAEEQASQFLSESTTPKALAQLALLKSPVARAVFAGETLADLPEDIRDIARAYKGGDKKELGRAITKAGISATIGTSLAAEPLGVTARVKARAAERQAERFAPREPIEPAVAREPVREELQPKIEEATLPTYEELVAAPKVPAAAEPVAGEGIHAAAIRINGRTFEGVDHAAAVEDYARQKGITPEQAWAETTTPTANTESGFTTTAGRFVDAEEAARIAKSKGSHAAEIVPAKPAAAEQVAPTTGQPIKLSGFHATDRPIEGDLNPDTWFTSKSEAADFYYSGEEVGGKKFEAAVTFKNPLVVSEDQFKSTTRGPTYWMQKAYEGGHDGVILTDIVDGDKRSTVFAPIIQKGTHPVEFEGRIQPIAKPAAAVEHPTTPEPTQVVAAPVAKQFEAEIKTNEELAAPAAPAIGPAPVPRGQVLSMGDLPVTMPRTVPGQVSAPEVMDSLKSVITTSGGVGAIRAGRFKTAFAKGIFKPFSEVIRLEHINDVPTAVHETGHALMKQMYGTVKSRGLNGFPSAVKTELVGLGKALYGTRRPTAGYTAEGFSEFLRTYLTTDTARQQTPNTYKFFTEQVLKDHPEIAKQLEGSRKLIDTYRGQGAVARANSQIVNEPGWTKRTLGAVKDFLSVESFFESAQPLKQMRKEAEAKLGRKLRPGEDPYKLYKMKRGSTGPIVEAFVEHNTVDNFGNPTGPPLKEAFSEIKGKAEANKFMLYLFGRRAVERWGKGINPGIAREDAAYLRQTLESPRFDKAAGKYYDYWDNVLKYVVEAEPAMADTVTKIKQGSTDYAPLARMLDEGAAKREAMKMKSNPMHKMHGSGLPVKDIFQQTIVGTARLISRANRSLVMNSVVKLAQIEGMGKYIEEVPRSMAQKSVNMEGIRADLENLGLDTSKIPDDQILDNCMLADQPKGTDPIIPYRDAQGQMHWYHVDPSIYRTLEALEPFSLKSIPHVGTTLDLLVGAPKRLFTLGTTGLRPTFSLITNPLRDPQAWLFQTKANPNPAKMVGAYFNGMRELLTELATGKSGPYEAAIKNLGPQMSQQLGRDIKYTTKVTKGLFHGRVMRVVKSPIDHLRQLLNIPEAFPRHAEFQRVAEQVGWKPGDKMTADQAVEMAIAYKEATVDFNAAGNVSRIVNEGVPFFNANLQGARTAVRAFRDHPLRSTVIGLSTLTTPAVLNWWKNKDEDWYKNLPWRERYTYSNIDDGKHVWQIPRPFEYSNLFQVLPEAALDSWYRKDPEALKAAVGQIFQTQNPFDLPVLARAAKEQWSNNIDFWDRPIIPKTEIDLAPGAQVGPYTSKIATWLGKAFPNTISPRRVDAALRSIGGGTIPDLLDMIGLGAEKKDRESEASDMAIAGKLFRRGGKYNAQSQHLADFWDIKDGVDARARAMVMQAKDPDRLQTIPINESDILMSKLFDKAAHRIKLTMQLTNDMRESKGRQELYKEAAEQAKEMVEIYQEQKRQDEQP